MRKLFEISSEEKQRILEMHESATKKNYLSEQSVQQGQPAAGTLINNVTYKLQGLTDKNIDKFLNNNYLVCDWFDTNIDFKKLGWGAECLSQNPENPCCDIKTHLKFYLQTLAKSFPTTADFVKYPFSKYLETSEKGKSLVKIWETKMQQKEPSYVMKNPLGGKKFDDIVFGLVLNGNNLPQAGLPKIPGTYNW